LKAVAILIATTTTDGWLCGGTGNGVAIRIESIGGIPVCTK